MFIIRKTKQGNIWIFLPFDVPVEVRSEESATSNNEERADFDDSTLDNLPRAIGTEPKEAITAKQITKEKNIFRQDKTKTLKALLIIIISKY